MQEKSTVTLADKNASRKIDAVRALQQLMHYAQQPAFSGFISVRVHAHGGKITKIVRNSEEHDTDD